MPLVFRVQMYLVYITHYSFSKQFISHPPPDTEPSTVNIFVTADQGSTRLTPNYSRYIVFFNLYAINYTVVASSYLYLSSV